VVLAMAVVAVIVAPAVVVSLDELLPHAPMPMHANMISSSTTAGGACLRICVGV
jgi:hypothetical protein